MEKDNRNWMVIAISLSSICVIIAFVKGKPFVPAYLEYPLYGFDIIGGVSGTYLIYLLSKYICKKSKRLVKVLSYIGNRTTEILCFHLIDQDCLSLLLPLPNSNILRLIIRLIIDIVGGIGLHLLLQKRGITMSIKQVIKKVSVVNNLNWGISLFQYYRNEHRECSALKFILQNVTRLKSIHPFDNKWNQIEALMNSVDILPNQNSSFFYSIDVFKRAEQKNHMMDNYSIDYSWVVNSCFYDMSKMIDEDSYYRDVYQGFIAIMQRYLLKIKSDNIIGRSFKRNIAEIESLFTRPAEHLHEAIQRILFVNQWLWQTGHKHNGFGHLDWILYKFYKEDIASGYITKEDAKQYLHDFFKVLHDKCWFKSTMLLGDTGQIVILGGLGEDGKYRCNELTYLLLKYQKNLSCRILKCFYA